MGRKALAAILLPLPFAALPIAVVAVGAVFGPGPSDELVIREDASPASEMSVSTETTIVAPSLASVSEPMQFDPCAEYDLRSES
jgi:hypothetical protein